MCDHPDCIADTHAAVIVDRLAFQHQFEQKPVSGKNMVFEQSPPARSRMKRPQYAERQLRTFVLQLLIVRNDISSGSPRKPFWNNYGLALWLKVHGLAHPDDHSGKFVTLVVYVRPHADAVSR